MGKIEGLNGKTGKRGVEKYSFSQGRGYINELYIIDISYTTYLDLPKMSKKLPLGWFFCSDEKATTIRHLEDPGIHI